MTITTKLMRLLRHWSNTWEANEFLRQLKIDEEQQIHRWLPVLDCDARKQIEQKQEELRPFHNRYITKVSDARATISLQTAAIAAFLIAKLQPRRVVDLGSGFSSYACRKESQQIGVEHWSVDDSPLWLSKTAEFLGAEGISNDRLMLWDEFSTTMSEGSFDLVVHDLGHRTTRIIVLPQVLKLVSKKGVLILDDMHKSDYRGLAKRLLETTWELIPLPALTLDQFGRFAYAAVHRPEPSN